MGKELGYDVAKFYQKVRGEFVFIATDQDVMDFGLGFDVKKRVVQIYMKHVELTNVVGVTQASETIKNKSRPTPIVINEDPDHEDSDDYDPESSSSEDESDVDFHDSDYNLSDDDNLVETIPERNVQSEGMKLSNKPEIDQSYKETLKKLANIDGDSDSGSRDAVKEHGIKNGKVINFLKSDRSKVRTVCKGGKRSSCPWVIYAAYVLADKVFKVKTYDDTHTCTRSYHVPWVRTRWICNKYTDRIRSNPTWPIKSPAQTIKKKWTCKVSMPRVFRAKKRALNSLGCYAYAEEVISSNPGTRVVIKAKPVVGSENQLVGEDLGIVNSHAWTFMSDKQKGLIDAVSELFPNASHRFCVRHLYNNFKGNFKGLVLKDILRKAARATSIPAFRNAMEEMKKADLNAYKWLYGRPPKCDILLNDLCGSFNSAILIARDQSIISMLERIRYILTEMVVKRREAMEKCMGDICPKIYKLVEKMKGHVGEWVTTYTGNNKYEVSGLGGLGDQKKARRRQPEEEATVPPDPTKLGRKGTKMACSKCGVQGHNKRSCKTKEPVREQSAPVDEMAEQSARGTSRVVRRQMNKTKHNQVEQNKGLTLSQPQSQVDDPVPS
ncbi:hypothetical protein Vadar_027656 [Vaccinium darrowii]|uniref:Uncharacterized protein n=1 Tax=Vaccinium darrowii TaxID=229202 RepID=A0ACB7Y937_9ERIC|nr:hypothetical protein Vadar_027656 [Vaccinium darrowii]